MGNESSSNTTKSTRISNLTAVTRPSESPVTNKEDVILIWLDKSIDKIRTTLRDLTNYVSLYTEFEPCQTYIQSITTERIFLIISGSYAELYLDQLHDLVSIDSIFIFCMNLDKYKTQYLNSEKYSKIIGIFNNESNLIESIRQELNDLHKQLATFSLYKNEKLTRNLRDESASFLWFQLFKDILLQMPHSEQAKNDMIDQCKYFYRGNHDELHLIQQFEQTYIESDTIHWYTKQCFLYRLCNKALRTEDIELLYLFRYYIQDLCKRLAVEYETYKVRLRDRPIIEVYRGLKLTKDEIEKYQLHIGSLISTNGFLSTSQNDQLAIEFALKKSKRIDVLPTLFIIEADVRTEHAVFADISSLSVYPDEEEILFDIGCAFRINNVNFDSEKSLWIVKMKLVDEGRQMIEKFIEINRKEMEKGNIFLIFGLLLTEMGQYDQAQIYFENLLSSKTIDDLLSIYTNLGQVKYYKGLYDEALKDFLYAREFYEKSDKKNDIDLARITNNLGLVYMEQKNYDLAFNHFVNVIKMSETRSDIDPILIATTNNAIGIIFSYKHDYKQSLDYLLLARKLYEEHLPTIDHHLIAMNYNRIGLTYYYLKDYRQSLDFCSKAYSIREQILPNHHSDLGDSCNNLGLIYQQLFEYKRSLEYFQRALKIYENHSNKKTNCILCWNNIGLLYRDQNEFDQAIASYLKALEYQDELAYTYANLGDVYEMKGNNEQAVKSYKQSLDNYENDSIKFVEISMKIANIYYKVTDYSMALEYYQKSLARSEKSTPDVLANLCFALGLIYHQQKNFNAALDFYKRCFTLRKQFSEIENLDFAWLYNNIGCLYDEIGDLSQALKYQEKAYQIRKQYLPSTHLDLAVSLINLGRIHQTIAHQTNLNPSELNQAFECYKNAFHIRRKSLDNDHADLALAYFNLALIHYDQKEYEQAFVEIQKTLNIQKKSFSIDHFDVQQSIKLEKQIRQMLDYQKNKSNLVN